MTDFQDFFVVLFWPPLAMMLGVYAGVMILAAIVHILTASISHYSRRDRSTAFGQDFDED